MIDYGKETLLTLTEAAASLPRRRGGKRVNVATMYRWTTHGCRGERLETIQIGGTRFTSQEALQRFFDRLSSPINYSRAKAGVSPPLPSDSRSARENAAVVAELERLGL
jgi:hypothetical protein